jgi:hypothetical protein
MRGDSQMGSVALDGETLGQDVSVWVAVSMVAAL